MITAESQPTGPVFVIGMNGSGTSMLLDCLGRHPALFAIPDETHLLPYILGEAGRFGDLLDDGSFHRYCQFALDNLSMLRKLDPINKKMPRIPDGWREFERTPGGMIDGMFGSFATEAGKRRWCEKTPDYVQHIALLSQVFPGSQFIHMIRDGREVAASIMRRQSRRPELIVYRWKKLIELGRRDGSRLGSGRYTEVHYEALTSDPQREMERLCAFMGLEFDPAVLQSRMPQNPAHVPLGSEQIGQISSNPMKWKEYFSDTQVASLERIGGCMLQELGYEVGSSPGDRDIGWFSARLWRASDFLRRTLQSKGTNRFNDSWWKVLKNAAMSAKAYRTKKY